MNEQYTESVGYVEPVDAATLILLRGDQVLMGLRSKKHIFMPNVYVFPGGRTDEDDQQLRSARRLAPVNIERMGLSVGAERAEAIGLTAIRETYEETGLIVGHRADSVEVNNAGWKNFYQNGFEPALDQLNYFARAITPVGSPRRFDARFFLADASIAKGELLSNGELLDLQWIDLQNASELKLPTVTALVLELLKCKVSGEIDRGEAIAAEFESRHGREVFEYFLDG